MEKQSVLEIWGKVQPGLWFLNWPQEKIQALLSEVHT